jgi:GNAT superfamily N-acetyltransferase
MIKIEKITFQETFPVRHPVLRAGKPIESCHFDGDELDSTKHFGIFIDNILVGVTSLFMQHHSFFDHQTQMQMRGMAILDSYQKQGLGEKLLVTCEDYLKKEKNALLWFNARAKAVPFYEKLGYQIIGNSFEIGDIGTHYVMYKQL